MSFEQLQQAILDEAKQQIGEINSRYEKKLTAEEERIKARAKTLEEEIITKAQKDGKMEAQRLHQSAQLAARAEILKVKQIEMEKVLQESKEVIIKWDKEQVQTLVTSLLKLIPETEGTVTAGAAHEEIVKKLATKKGLKVNKKTIVAEGGFIFKGDRTELNATISHLLKQLFEHERSTIAKVLFD